MVEVPIIGEIPIPAWLVWVIALLGVFIIWNYFLSEESKTVVWGLLKRYFVWLIIIAAYIYMRTYWGYFTEADSFFGRKANTFALYLVLLWGLAVNFLGRERYVSTQAICDNRSGSCASYKEVGDYIILNIGSCDASLFPWEWGHESWVIPKRHFNKINGKPNASQTQILIKTNIVQVDLTEVPPQCHDFIETTSGYNKEIVYYGEFSLAELESGETITYKGGKNKAEQELTMEEYETKMKDAFRMINEARAMVKGKTKSILGFISNVSTIQRKAKGTERTAPRPTESEV